MSFYTINPRKQIFSSNLFFLSSLSVRAGSLLMSQPAALRWVGLQLFFITSMFFLNVNLINLSFSLACKFT